MRNFLKNCLESKNDDEPGIKCQAKVQPIDKTPENLDNPKNLKNPEKSVKSRVSTEKPRPTPPPGVNPEIIDQVVASMDDLAQMRMVQELAKTRRRVSIVPDTTTIVEDQFLEPMAAETGIEADKAADRLTRNDRRRMVRRISLQIARNEIENTNQTPVEKLKQTRRTIADYKRSNMSLLSNKNERRVHSVSDRKASYQDLKKELTNLQDFIIDDNGGLASKSKTSIRSANKKCSRSSKNNQATNSIASSCQSTQASTNYSVNSSRQNSKESGFSTAILESRISETPSDRSSNSYISDGIDNRTSKALKNYELSADDRYDKQLEKFRRNTLHSLHRGSIGCAEASAGLICAEQTKKTLQLYKQPSEIDKNTYRSNFYANNFNGNEDDDRKTTEESMKVIGQKSEVALNNYVSYKRKESIYNRDKKTTKLVANEDNVSAYPLPGTDFSTKMGGTWKPTNNAKNLLTEDEIAEVIHKTLDEEMDKQLKKMEVVEEVSAN